MGKETGQLLATWAALMALLAITVVAALAPIGPVKGLVNIAAAVVKAALIYWVFMHLKQVGGFLRIAAVGAAVWLLILGAMLYADISTRV
ncbi:MAG TPA: cytochrome C oxidase subunit IV family protein [Caulobacteraceae bacterium]|jgi:cytochrome c oxidase subunit 4